MRRAASHRTATVAAHTIGFPAVTPKASVTIARDNNPGQPSAERQTRRRHLHPVDKHESRGGASKSSRFEIAHVRVTTPHAATNDLNL
jgi:hypothetical protein